MECDAAQPVTLAEFTLGTGGQDLYDVSLVDGYNMPMIVQGSGGSGLCASTGCTTDLNRKCPSELQVGDACEAFGRPDIVAAARTAHPPPASRPFIPRCSRPRAPDLTGISYAYDDATSTFTCAGADYTVTFCPSSPSQISTPAVTETTPMTGSTPQGSGSESGLTYSDNGYGYSGSGYTSSGYGYSGSGYSYSGSSTEPGGSGQTMLTDGSWLAGLAMGDSATTAPCILLHALITLSLVFSWHQFYL